MSSPFGDVVGQLLKEADGSIPYNLPEESIYLESVRGLRDELNSIVAGDSGFVVDPGTIDHDALLNFLQTEHYLQSAIVEVGIVATGTWNADVITEVYGGTGESSYTLGDVLYSDGANSLSSLSGNTTTTKKFLTQTGDGAISAAPGWNTLLFADLPDMAVIGSPTFTTIQHMQDIFHSSGWTSGGVLSDAGGGDIDVASGTGLLRAADTRNLTLSYFDWSTSAGNTVPDGTARFFGVEYSGGSPQVVMKNTDTWDYNTDFPLGSAVREGATLHISQAEHAVGDHASAMIRRMFEVNKFQRDNNTGGLILSDSADTNRYVEVSAGAIWERLNRTSFPAFDSDPGGGGDTFDTYKHVSSTFTLTTGVTQWPNTQYDDGADLVTMDSNKYANLWFYGDSDGEVAMVYGTAQYNKSALAELEEPPSSLPIRIQTHSFLLGRMIFQKSATTAIQVDTVFETVFLPTQAADHGNLSGLTDDDHTQYHTDGRALTWLGTRSTTDLSEGSNLYYTNARADARIAAAKLEDLNDVTITSIASGEILKWNGSLWINNTLAEAGISATGHTHTNITPVDSTDASSFIAMFDSATGDQAIKTDGGLTYNATTASLATTTFVGALTGNASTATILANARDINGVSFDGSANITVTADANTLTNTTLKSTVVSSSLTSLGTQGETLDMGTNSITNVGTYSGGGNLSITLSDTSGAGVRCAVSNTSTATNSYAIYITQSDNGTVTAQFYTDGLGGGPLGTPGMYLGNFSNHPIGIFTNNTEKIRITAGGNVLIGTTTDAGQKLQVVGTFRVSGTTNFNTVEYTWPASDGGSGDLLTTNGTGGLSWTAGGGGGLGGTGTAGKIAKWSAASTLTDSIMTESGTTLTVVNTVVATTFTGALTGNASTATLLQNARDINGVSFNGGANITVTADANTLTNTTLKSTVIASSLTSVGTLSSLDMSGNIDLNTNNIIAGGTAAFTTIDVSAGLVQSAANSATILSGGDAITTGANLVLYGQSAGAGRADDWEFRMDTTITMDWDQTAAELTVFGQIVMDDGGTPTDVAGVVISAAEPVAEDYVDGTIWCKV